MKHTHQRCFARDRYDEMKVDLGILIFVFHYMVLWNSVVRLVFLSGVAIFLVWGFLFFWKVLGVNVHLLRFFSNRVLQGIKQCASR